MGRARQGLIYAAGIVWMVLLFVVMAPVLLVWPTRRWRARVSQAYARWWSALMLTLAGIRLEVTGREHLRTLPAVYLFNHSNILDFFVNAAIAPPHALVFGKRELTRVPALGWMWALGGHPLIARSDRDQWQAVMDDVSRCLATGRYCTIIAPEGKRSGDGVLLPFKKGPFHLALDGKAPVVPIVIQGVAPLLSRERGLLPGVVRVRVLPPIPSSAWTREDIEDHVEEVRAAFLEAFEAPVLEAQP